MEKILILDWDGPASNSRTWNMPGAVDPVAIKLLNDAKAAGWKTLLASTIRKNFKNLEEATAFMHAVDYYPDWYKVWRTDPHFTNRRHLEVANFMMTTDLPEDAIFLVVDDEHFPHEFLARGRMQQIHATSHAGLDYLSISNAYQIFKMSDAQLEEEFAVEDEKQ